MFVGNCTSKTWPSRSLCHRLATKCAPLRSRRPRRKTDPVRPTVNHPLSAQWKWGCLPLRTRRCSAYKTPVASWSREQCWPCTELFNHTSCEAPYRLHVWKLRRGDTGEQPGCCWQSHHVWTTRQSIKRHYWTREQTKLSARTVSKPKYNFQSASLSFLFFSRTIAILGTF